MAAHDGGAWAVGSAARDWQKVVLPRLMANQYSKRAHLGNRAVPYNFRQPRVHVAGGDMLHLLRPSASAGPAALAGLCKWVSNSQTAAPLPCHGSCEWLASACVVGQTRQRERLRSARGRTGRVSNPVVVDLGRKLGQQVNVRLACLPAGHSSALDTYKDEEGRQMVLDFWVSIGIPDSSCGLERQPCGRFPQKSTRHGAAEQE
jgi:hypothetical protein